MSTDQPTTNKRETVEFPEGLFAPNELKWLKHRPVRIQKAIIELKTLMGNRPDRNQIIEWWNNYA